MTGLKHLTPRAGLRHSLRSALGTAGSLRHHLITSVAGSFVLNLTQKVFMLGVTVLLARFMGAHDYGVYASAYAVLVLVVVPASLGFPSLIVRELATSRLRQQWALMRGLLTRSLQIGLLACAGVAIVLLIVQRYFVHDGYSAALLWLTYGMLPLMLLGAMRNAGLRGLHHVVLGMLPETLIVPVAFVVGIVLLWAIAPGMLTPTGAMALRLLAVALAFTVGAVCLWKKLPTQIFSVAPAYRTGKWLRAAAPMLWVGAMAQITMQTDVLMLSGFKGPTSAGIYQVAARGAQLVAFVSAVATVALQPTLARLYAAGELAHMRRVARIAARIMLAAAFVGACVYFLFGRVLLQNIFGPEFVAALPALLILSLGWVFVAAMGPARDTLLMTGGERRAAVIISIAASLNVVLDVLLIPRFGIEGASAATATSLVVCNAGYLWFARGIVGFRTSAV